MHRARQMGAERLDADHQELFRRLAELRAAIRAGIRSEVNDTLAFVRGYIGSHFALEEREMIASAYPMYHVHRAAHGRLAREVRVLELEWTRNGVTPALADRVLAELSDWFEVHVKELDAQLVRHLAAAATASVAVRGPVRAAGEPPSDGRLARRAGR